jgi:hypothetical protein
MKKEIQIYFISSQDQLVYVFTKSLLIASFTAFLLQASGRSSTQGLRGHIIGYIYIYIYIYRHYYSVGISTLTIVYYPTHIKKKGFAN